MLVDVLLYGSGAAVIHFLLIGILYSNPLVSRMYLAEENKNRALRVWKNKKHYMLLMFTGSLIEAWLLSLGYLLLRSAFPRSGSLITAVVCSLVLGFIRIYPRAFDKWIQTTYPVRLIVVESVNGMIGSFVIILSMRLLTTL